MLAFFYLFDGMHHVSNLRHNASIFFVTNIINLYVLKQNNL